MSVHISDSAIFQDAWTTPELRALFDDIALIIGWIEVMVVLAETQAEFGLIPAEAVKALAKSCRHMQIDETFLKDVRQGFEQTNHSLFGLIHALQSRCPDNSGEWLCYGATVQDITDTHMARILLKVSELYHAEMSQIMLTLAGLARRHRDTAMCGRTHGQHGLAITFGFKAAGWLDEIQRHHHRLREIKNRLGVGQLAGGVGSLSAFGAKAISLQREFCARLLLAAPAISWTSSRDRLAEWCNYLVLISATADRIGHEIYNLQRPEIGELGEGFVAGTVGSITMPQKRNPEISEHLGTLARLVRHQAAFMAENLVHDHERDGRSWKGEWEILPTVCLAAGKLLRLLNTLLANLSVNESQMKKNLLATQGFMHAERIMLTIAPMLGRQTAHTLVYTAAMAATESGIPLKEAILKDPQIMTVISPGEIENLLSSKHDTGCCGQMIDQVLAEFNP